jgi:trk system potassium uptake protein TrkA
VKRFAVIGLGNFGSTVAQTLHARGHEVVAIDLNPEAVDRIAVHASRAAVGDGSHPEVLEHVGVRGADAAIVSTGDDITASVLTTLALRDLGIEEVYVKVISAAHDRVMHRVGAAETIFPEREMAEDLGSRLCARDVMRHVRLGAGFSLQEMTVPKDWIGRKLEELDLQRRFGICIVAVHDVLTDQLDVVRDPGVVLKESDTLLVAGKDPDLAAAGGESRGRKSGSSQRK